MIRQCFFPTSYKRKSKNSFKAIAEPDSGITGSFVKRLDLSCRRPARSQKLMSNYTQNYNQTPTETDIFQFKRTHECPCKIGFSVVKNSEQKNKIYKNKLMVVPERKQISSMSIKEIKRRSTFHLGQNKTRRGGMREIKNEDWGANSNNNSSNKYERHVILNMTQRIKFNKKKEAENVIMGWDFQEDNDTFF